MSSQRVPSHLYITQRILLLSETRSICNEIYFIFYLGKTKHLIGPVLVLSYSSAKFRSRNGFLRFACFQLCDWKIILRKHNSESGRACSIEVRECNSLTSASFKQLKNPKTNAKKPTITKTQHPHTLHTTEIVKGARKAECNEQN